MISIFLVYPVDLIVELDDLGFPDFEVFSQYDIFMMLYQQNELVYRELIKFLLGDVNLSAVKNVETDEILLYDEEKDIKFDLTSYMILSKFIRTIHGIPEDVSKLAKKSKSLKRVLIETERIRKDYEAQQREKDRLNGKSDHVLQKMATKLSIASQYRRSELYDMKIYEFYDIWGEVISFYSWKYTMSGVYSATIDTKKINKKELNWFGN